MSKFKLIHDRPVCIGCGACAVIAPEFWEMNDDGKSDIIGGTHIKEEQHLDIEQKDFDINLEAAESCPVECIHLKDNETAKDII